MRFVTACILIAAIFAAFSQSLNAAVVYDESVSGDLPNKSQTAPLLSFFPGSNLIKGTEEVVFNGSGNQTFFDSDAFRFSISPGDVLVSASLSASQVLGNLTEMQFSISTSGAPIVLAVPGTKQIIGFGLPLGGGTYAIDPILIGVHTSQGDNSANYTFDFEVVPEPSTIALFSLGAIGLLFARRRFAG